MGCVYKIVGNFNNESFDKIINKLSQKFLFMYVDEVMFVALKIYDESIDSKKLLKGIFKPNRDFYIEEITEKNINKLSSEIKEWSLNNLVRLDLERYEKENQAKLKKVWENMDNMETQLNELLKQY